MTIDASMARLDVPHAAGSARRNVHDTPELHKTFNDFHGQEDLRYRYRSQPTAFGLDRRSKPDRAESRSRARANYDVRIGDRRGRADATATAAGLARTKLVIESAPIAFAFQLSGSQCMSAWWRHRPVWFEEIGLEIHSACLACRPLRRFWSRARPAQFHEHQRDPDHQRAHGADLLPRPGFLKYLKKSDEGSSTRMSLLLRRPWRYASMLR